MPSVATERQKMSTWDEVLTLSEAAAYLKLAERTMHRMIQRNEIPCARVGGQWRFMKSVLEDWLLSRMQVLPRNELAPFLDATNGIVRLAPMISLQNVVDPVEPGEPAAVLAQLVRPLVDQGIVTDRAKYVDLLLGRERLSSTAVGMGVAVPHVRRPEENPPGAPPVLLGVCREGVPFDAPDDKPVHFFFLLSTTSEVVHLRLLKRISLLFRERGTGGALLGCSSPQELITELRRREAEIFPEG
jgi:excisionase family DNA binding protein